MTQSHPDDRQTPQQPPPPQAPPGSQFSPPYPPPMPPYNYGQAGAHDFPPGTYFDSASGLALPNGVQLASCGRRVGAYFLSILLALVTLGIGYVVWGLIVWARGQTPALQVLGMRVWRPESNKPASWGYMALREIIGRIVDGILSIITGLISFILMFTTHKRQTLHDMVAGTVVLYDPNKVIPR